MEILVQQVISGLATGGIYGSVALALGLLVLAALAAGRRGAKNY
jgi:hypothetical protein